jgi:nucleoside-diphosphate-sugar epimerase
MFHRLYGCQVVSVRPFMTYGPAQARDKVIPSTILSLLSHESPKLTTGGRALDWIYVDDVIDGLLRAATAPGAEGRTIDLGSGTAVPLRAVVEHLVQIIDPSIIPMFGALPERPSDDVRVARLDRASVVLGWRPTTSLEDGLGKTVEWFRVHHAERVNERQLGAR